MMVYYQLDVRAWRASERASTLEMQGTAVQNNLHVRRPAAKRKRKKWREDRMPDDLRSEEYEPRLCLKQTAKSRAFKHAPKMTGREQLAR
jgi:hypothetical protein